MRGRLQRLSRALHNINPFPVAMDLQPSSSCPFVQFAAEGRCRIVRLTRPRAMNALNHDMVRAITQQLHAWSQSPLDRESASCIVLMADSDAAKPAFCAGGDIIAMSVAPHADAVAFFRDEYVLNHMIGTYPKPIVSLIDGVCMGGGAGLSMHGTFRVATERSVFAMPEAGIGFFPDVGASFFLPRLVQPAALGLYLALTGSRLSGPQL